MNPQARRVPAMPTGSSSSPVGGSGFTLVEVLVAMVVMAVMALMAWQGVDGIVRSRNASQARLDQTLRLSTVIAQWDQDLASIQASGGVSPALTCDGSTVRLTRHTPDGLQVVAWSLRPDDRGGAWIRWAGPPVTTAQALQDSWVRSLQLQGREAGSLRTLTGLSGWQVYYFFKDQVTWSNCQSTGDASLPKGVRIVLSFVPGSGINGDLTRDVSIGP